MSWKIKLATNEAHHASDLDAAVGDEHPEASWTEHEQMRLARNLASQVVASGAVGSNGKYAIELSGDANDNHDAGESLTVTVTGQGGKKKK